MLTLISNWVLGNKFVLWSIGILVSLGFLWIIYYMHIEGIKRDVLQEANRKQLELTVKQNERLTEILTQNNLILNTLTTSLNENRARLEQQFSDIDTRLNQNFTLEQRNRPASEFLRETVRELERQAR